jgi:hypothetical protein
MQPCTSPDYWTPILESVLPAVGVVASGIALWVVARLRSTSEAEQRMLSSLVTNVQRSSDSPDASESPGTARVRRKSSTKGTTSTSPGRKRRRSDRE